MRPDQLSFDAVITDSNGEKLGVDCRITEPLVSGAPANILIEIPLGATPHAALKCPCTLTGGDGGLKVDIRGLTYKRMPVGGTHRKYARDTMDLLHVETLRISHTRWSSKKAIFRLSLSPVRVLEAHFNGNIVHYGNVPEMMVELFKIQVPGLGAVAFIKHWSIHRVKRRETTAEVRASFAAQLFLDEEQAANMEPHTAVFRDGLVVLSMLFRQSVTLHGWEAYTSKGLDTVWLDPLDPNLAPDMGEEPAEDMVFPDEFQDTAQALIAQYFSASPQVKKVVEGICRALTPGVKLTTASHFSLLFSAIEKAVALTKVTQEEQKRLEESNAALVEALTRLESEVANGEGPHTEAVTKRIQGLVGRVTTDGPSFKVRLEKFEDAYPKFKVYKHDLWPIIGTDKAPGLKHIRDALAHGLYHRYNPQALAVARWHMCRLAERMVFILLAIEVPKGIRPGSSLMHRDEWCEGQYWRDVQASASRNEA